MKKKNLSLMLMSLIIASETLISMPSATIKVSELKPVEVSNPSATSNKGGDRESKEEKAKKEKHYQKKEEKKEKPQHPAKSKEEMPKAPSENMDMNKKPEENKSKEQMPTTPAKEQKPVEDMSKKTY